MMMKRFSLAIAPAVAALAPRRARRRRPPRSSSSARPRARRSPRRPARRASRRSHCFIILHAHHRDPVGHQRRRNPTKVNKAGWIVAFTVGLSKLSSRRQDRAAASCTYSTPATAGTPQLALTVLKPGPKNKYTVAAQSPTFHLLPFLGQVLQEPLSLPPTFTTITALPVKKGEVIGLTVPTWAPVLPTTSRPPSTPTARAARANCTNAAGEPDRPDDRRRQRAVPVQLHGHAGRVQRRPRSSTSPTPRPTSAGRRRPRSSGAEPRSARARPGR